MAARKPAATKKTHTPVEATVHQDKRANIPTADAQDFLPPEAEQPKTLLYPRDPSLDPQLVWKGKDEQDAHDLEVVAPPIFIQEKIDPRVLIENLRQTSKAGEAEPELTLFDRFDGLDGLEIVDFYQHEANWSNRMILGDSLQVMASLAEREGLRGKVQMIYIDPPYGVWMIDTNYNEESFFVRHCYFTGGNDPYERLKRALKADIDEEAWATLYQTVSRPFPKPETGKIAVKVINDYGDEVMQVFEVG